MHSSPQDLSSQLRELAQSQRAKATAWFAELDKYTSALLLIEAARVMDIYHVSSLGRKPDHLDKIPLVDLQMRGWNPLLEKLLPKLPDCGGIPIQESTPESQALAYRLLRDLGTIALLDKLSEMAYHGFISGEVQKDCIHLKTTFAADSDHFLDQLEQSRLEDTVGSENGLPVFEWLHLEEEKIDKLIESLVFPFDTRQGRMVGYGADPDLDMHFINLVFSQVDEWRNQSGIHPDAVMQDIDGALMAGITLMLVSFYIKHIRFVGVGVRVLENVNYAMSITIWKKPEDLASSISEFFGISEPVVLASLRAMLITRNDATVFGKEQNPLFPLLIEITPGFWLAPVSGIFRNPLNLARRLSEHRAEAAQDAIRMPREAWMVKNLYSLFMGTRYIRISSPVRLQYNGKILTDIDAAIFDTTNGELAIFQLKWQDFDTGNLRKIRSRGKRFVESVDEWTKRVENYLATQGIREFCKCLQLKIPKDLTTISIRYFAIGQSAARFKSYGYELQNHNVAPCTWPQFLRLRYVVGPSTYVISEIHKRAIDEKNQTLERVPIPYSISVAGTLIRLDDLWGVYPDKQDSQ